jgi:hypothetical protein
MNGLGGIKMPSFKCKDMGMSCKFEVKTANADEIMPLIALHACFLIVDNCANLNTVPDVGYKFKARRKT